MILFSYSCFVDGKIEMLVNNFVVFFENFNVIFDEYFYINNGY